MDRRPATALTLAAAAFLSLGTLTGCNTSAAGEDAPPTIIETMPPPPETTSSDDYGMTALGKDYTYPDGITVNVTQTRTTITDDEYATTATLPAGSEIPVYRFTITNNSDQPYVPDFETTFITYGPETTRADQTFTADVEGSGSLDIGTILPGNSYSEERAYEVPAGSDDIVIEYGTDMSRAPVIFTSE